MLRDSRGLVPGHCAASKLWGWEECKGEGFRVVMETVNHLRIPAGRGWGEQTAFLKVASQGSGFWKCQEGRDLAQPLSLRCARHGGEGVRGRKGEGFAQFSRGLLSPPLFPRRRVALGLTAEGHRVSLGP